MRKRKGAALPGAVLIGFLLLGVSLAIAALIMQSSAAAAYSKVQKNNEDIYDASARLFVSSTHDAGQDYDTRFDWKIFEGEEDIYGLAAYSKTSDASLQFYCVYDFDSSNPKMLAYQTSNFYITESGGYRYLGGLVKEVLD